MTDQSHMAEIPTTVDRAAICVQRAINCGWITIHGPNGGQQLLATIRLALDTEVQAGGPYAVKELPNAD